MEQLFGNARAGIFQRALPFVYGLTVSGQKPERREYTETDTEFERQYPTTSGNGGKTRSRQQPEPEEAGRCSGRT